MRRIRIAQGASLGVGNSFVGIVTMKKTYSHPFDKIPTYDERHALFCVDERHALFCV